MALSKKMLQAMDISDDKIEQIIEAHRDTINGLTAERDELKESVDKYKAEAAKLSGVEKDLTKAQAKLEEAEETAQKLKEVQKAFDDFKAEVNVKAEQAAKEKAYRELLKSAGVSDKRLDTVLKVTDLSEVELDKDNKVKDSDKLIESIKTEWADFIVTREAKGAKTATPPEGNGGSTFEKMTLAEKMAYANENPDNAEVKTWLK